ncbi:MAG: hypothetical protein M1579_03645 [Gammaproteobacteria bacterium]|nr:hypothetical protein [Gammaproteobacteria bacterium]
MSLNVTSLCVFDDKLVIGSDKGYIYIYSLLNGNMLKKICSRLGEVKDIKVHSNGILCIIDEYVVFWEISVNNLLAKKEKILYKEKDLANGEDPDSEEWDATESWNSSATIGFIEDEPIIAHSAFGLEIKYLLNDKKTKYKMKDDLYLSFDSLHNGQYFKLRDVQQGDPVIYYRFTNGKIAPAIDFLMHSSIDNDDYTELLFTFNNINYALIESRIKDSMLLVCYDERDYESEEDFDLEDFDFENITEDDFINSVDDESDDAEVDLNGYYFIQIYNMNLPETIYVDDDFVLKESLWIGNSEDDNESNVYYSEEDDDDESNISYSKYVQEKLLQQFSFKKSEMILFDLNDKYFVTYSREKLIKVFSLDCLTKIIEFEPSMLDIYDDGLDEFGR